MNTQLKLRVQKSFSQETITHGAIVEVRSLNEAGRTISTRREAVPMGMNASVYRSVSVEPGIYEISTVLPSGENVVRTLEVIGDEEDVDATLEGDPKYIERSPWYGFDEERKFKLSHGDVGKLRHTFHISGHGLELSGEFALLERPVNRNETRDEVWDRVCGGLSELDIDSALDPGTLFNDLPSRVAHFEQVSPIAIRVGSDCSRPLLVSRTYLIAKYNGLTMLCVMPWPWRGIDGDDVPVEAVISENSEDARSPWSVKTSVKEDRYLNLLEYFSAGEERIAIELLSSAENFLYDKFTNPLAASAGAYILLDHWLNSSKEGEESEWMHWIKNLNVQFPWLPDASILRGWVALRMRQNEPALDDARRLLLQAERSGIPVYTAGVRRLADGLMLIAGEAFRRGQKDQEVGAALGRVRRLAWQIDPAQPFTCIRLWNH